MFKKMLRLSTQKYLAGILIIALAIGVFPQTSLATGQNQNVALNKVATANGYSGDAEPSKAVDGINNGEEDKWCYYADGDKWLSVDLGQEYQLNRYVVKHAGAFGEDARYNTRDFRLQKSIDGNVWIDVDVVTGNSENITDRTLPAFQARWVRLYLPEDEDQTARIYELEVYEASTQPVLEEDYFSFSGAFEKKETYINVAENRGGSTSGFAEGQAPSKALNGFAEDDDDKWCEFSNTDKWLAVDLRGEYTISKWVVQHAGVLEDLSRNTVDFKLQKSQDGVNWQDVDAVTGNTESITEREVTPFTAKHARLYITNPGPDQTARIYELQLFEKREEWVYTSPVFDPGSYSVFRRIHSQDGYDLRRDETDVYIRVAASEEALETAPWRQEKPAPEYVFNRRGEYAQIQIVAKSEAAATELSNHVYQLSYANVNKSIKPVPSNDHYVESDISILANASFEVDSDWDNLPDNWSRSTHNQYNEVAISLPVLGNAPDGQKVLQLTADTRYNDGLKRGCTQILNYAFQAGEHIEVAFDIKGLDLYPVTKNYNDGFRVDLIYETESGDYREHKLHGRGLQDTFDWTQVTFRYKFKEDVRKVGLFISFRNVEVGGKGFVDDIRFKKFNAPKIGDPTAVYSYLHDEYPIGIYTDRYSDLETYARLGYNLIKPIDWEETLKSGKYTVEHGREHGLFVLPELKIYDTYDETVAKVDDMIASIPDRSNLFGWKLTDEPQEVDFSQVHDITVRTMRAITQEIIPRKAMVVEKEPDKFEVIVSNEEAWAGTYAQYGADIVGAETYLTTGRFLDVLETTRVSLNGEASIWGVIGNYNDYMAPNYWTLDAYTANHTQMRAYTAVIQGAQGLLHFRQALNGQAGTDRSTEHFRFISDVLVYGEDRTGVHKTSQSGSIQYRVMDYDTNGDGHMETFIMATEVAGNSASLGLDLGVDTLSQAYKLFSDDIQGVQLMDGQMQLDFGGYETKIIRVMRNNDADAL